MTASTPQPDRAIPFDSQFSTTRILTLDKPASDRQPRSKFQSTLFLEPNEQRQGEGGLRVQGYYKQASLATGKEDLQPLVTVITVVYNGAKLLEETIGSVIQQTYDNVEYIVIDGGSTDETLDIIRRYEEQIDYWVSQPDGGIPDAMNKGIRLSQGDLIHHLHAGDLFDRPETIAEVVRSYQEHGWRWCYGNQKKINSAGEVDAWLYPSKFSLRRLRLGNIIPHATVFSERSLLQEVGYFDNRFQCGMDYHLWLRYAEVAEPYKIEQIVARFLAGGVSADAIYALKDEIRVRRDVLKQTPLQKAIDFCVVVLRYFKWKLKINTFARKTEKR